MLKLAVALALVLSATVAGAKHCKKGQPCGNSCISWSKVCRTPSVSESNSDRPAPTPGPAPKPGKDARGETARDPRPEK